MTSFLSRAGLSLGAIGIVCAPAARADDPGSSQALVESALFLSQAEAEAVYARLDAPRPEAVAGKPTPGATAFWEHGAVGLRQADRAGRVGWTSDVTQMRLGLDREIRNGLVVGAVTAAAIGSLGSAELAARTLAQHADLYARIDGGRLFAKSLVGLSYVNFADIARGSFGGSASAYGLRTGGQVGARARLAGVTLSPSVALTANGIALSRYRQFGPSGARFAPRDAGLATGAVRLSGTKAIMAAPGVKVELSASVGADEVIAYKAAQLRSHLHGAGVVAPVAAAPNGRGVFAGLGVATAIAQGVSIKVDYDYGRRDGAATRSGRAKLGVAF